LPRPWRSALLATVPLGLAGTGASAIFLGSRIDNGYGFFIPIHGRAAFGLTVVLFRLIVIQASSTLRGVLVGVVVGGGSHPLAWYIGMMYNAVVLCSEGRTRDAIGPIIGIAGAFTYSLMSWLCACAGWLTLPVGGIVGGLNGSWLARRASPAAATELAQERMTASHAKLKG
jgi:hypothetical protein